MKPLNPYWLCIAIFRRNDDSEQVFFADRVDYALIIKRRYANQGIIASMSGQSRHKKLFAAHESGRATSSGRAQRSFCLDVVSLADEPDLVCLLILGEIADTKRVLRLVSVSLDRLRDNEEEQIGDVHSSKSSESAEKIAYFINNLCALHNKPGNHSKIMSKDAVLDCNVISTRSERVGCIYLDLEDERRGCAGKTETSSSSVPLPQKMAEHCVKTSVPTYDLTTEQDVTLQRTPFVHRLVAPFERSRSLHGLIKATRQMD